MIIPKLFVLKIDLCVKVVALIKIMTVDSNIQKFVKLIHIFPSSQEKMVLSRLLDSFYIFVEENTKLRKVSDTFSAITKTL